VQAKAWCFVWVQSVGLSQSKGLVLCAGAKQTKQGFGLSYNQKFGALVGAVRVYLTSKL
jgi:hypothetical protein